MFFITWPSVNFHIKLTGAISFWKLGVVYGTWSMDLTWGGPWTPVHVLYTSSSALQALKCLWWGPQQRPLARWLHPQLLIWIWARGVVCLFIFFRRGATVSNNFTKRCQNGFKIGTRQVCDTFEVGKLYFKWELFTQFVLRSVIFAIQFSKHTSCRVPQIFWTWGACDTLPHHGNDIA